MNDVQTSADAAASKVTIVVSFRERWSLTPRTLDSIVQNTQAPYRLCVLDTGMPEGLRTMLPRRAEEWEHGLEIVDAQGLWPNHARARMASRIDTPYVVFIDNDVLVMPGWLETLLACADDTGAGIVGPLYLLGKDENANLIHMAGGELTIAAENGKIVMEERHRHINTPLAEVEGALKREPCGFAEFHCMLMRREVLQASDTFNPDIITMHEHIHASLVAQQLGYETWMEPAARVLYLAQSPWNFAELPLLRHRWSRPTAEHSLRHFAQKWNVIDDMRSFGGARHFLGLHLDAVDPLRADERLREFAGTCMRAADLMQTPSGLIALAHRRGYAPPELQQLGMACKFAARLSDGLYRPCGRPFVNHLIGTASVLAHYGFVPRLIKTALLHAALTHGRPADSESHNGVHEPESLIKQIAGPAVEAAVRAYAMRKRRYSALFSKPVYIEELGIDDVELLLLEAANLIDIDLSLEAAATGREDLPNESLLNFLIALCRKVGVPGMAQTLEELEHASSDVPKLKFHSEPGSFVFTATGTASAVKSRIFIQSDPLRPDESSIPELRTPASAQHDQHN